MECVPEEKTRDVGKGKGIRCSTSEGYEPFSGNWMEKCSRKWKKTSVGDQQFMWDLCRD